jgi:hypothetical protein
MHGAPSLSKEAFKRPLRGLVHAFKRPFKGLGEAFHRPLKGF